MAKKNEKPEEKAAVITCGLIMPTSAVDGYPASHWEEVRAIIAEALEPAGYKTRMVSDADETTIIHRSIVNNIFDDEIIICDLSSRNPNVMFELGMRLTFDKATVLIKDDLTNYAFDTGVIEHLTYPKDLRYALIEAFKKKLREKVIATHDASKKPAYSAFLHNFKKITPNKIEESKVGSMDYLVTKIDELTEKVNEMRREPKNEGLLSSIKLRTKAIITRAQYGLPNKMVDVYDKVKSLVLYSNSPCEIKDDLFGIDTGNSDKAGLKISYIIDMPSGRVDGGRFFEKGAVFNPNIFVF